MNYKNMSHQLFGSTRFKMGKFKNWLITKLLEKDKLVCVPVSWQKDYVRLAGDKVQNKQIIASLITEYNGLLKDYFDKCSIEELREELSHKEEPIKEDATKEELVELAYEEFRMTIESD